MSSEDITEQIRVHLATKCKPFSNLNTLTEQQKTDVIEATLQLMALPAFDLFYGLAMQTGFSGAVENPLTQESFIISVKRL